MKVLASLARVLIEVQVIVARPAYDEIGSRERVEVYDGVVVIFERVVYPVPAHPYLLNSFLKPTPLPQHP